MWLERRTAYTRSTGVMSMVGYLLGLGDRHPSNLMLDRYSGKLLHIDFGDCFEASMHREKFPEKVCLPFFARQAFFDRRVLAVTLQTEIYTRPRGFGMRCLIRSQSNGVQGLHGILEPASRGWAVHVACGLAWLQHLTPHCAARSPSHSLCG